MAKGTWHGSARKDSPIFSTPVFISSVHRLSEYQENTQTKENTSGETPQTSSQEKTTQEDKQ